MSPIIEVASTMCLYILGAAMCLTFYRLWHGPSPQDRTIALDLFSTLVVGLLTVHAIRTDEQVYLTAAIAIAIISFIGTVAIAQYIFKRGRR
jgi:multicomponent Na+:H+ antiporter subunit F